MKHRNLIDENMSEVEEYCRLNNLDIEKILDSVMSFSFYDTAVLYHAPGSGKGGLRNETPCPLLLRVFKTDSGLRFEQTENTHKYLAM